MSEHEQPNDTSAEGTAAPGGAATPVEPKPRAKKAARKGKSSKGKSDSSAKSGTAAKVSAPTKGQNLVIVESPAKAKTINKYLGRNYVVKASIGHVRDLPKSKLGIDIEHDFAPQYMTIRGKKEVIDELKKYARVAPKVFLATDPDREGEAIAWHLKECLKLEDARAARVTFNEITQSAVKQAFQKPRDIEMKLVDAQQARRVLDRLVGYSISPILWRKIAKGLSAGRVQSVALRMICEREEEIKRFVPVEYWTISAWLMTSEAAKAFGKKEREKFLAAIASAEPLEEVSDVDPIDQRDEVETESDKAGEKKKRPKLPDGMFCAELKKWKGEALAIADAATAQAILDEIRRSPFSVASIENKERKDRPKPPFITSTLQQAASLKLGFTARRTMRTAQSLYEGVALGAEGATGLITYMRTDSVHISDFAMDEAREEIGKRFGAEYLPEEKVMYKTSSRAQAAHEAIRPTSAARSPESVREHLSPEQFKLYSLIWERFIACQMKPAVYAVTSVEIQAGQATFRVGGRRLLFDGHARVSGIRLESAEQLLPELREQQSLACEHAKSEQHFTQPPARYSEASLVQTLEKNGIGRPSTYAAIISTIVDRGYCTLDRRRFFATELGMMVNGLLIGNFSRIVDPEFTAKMESQLDKIEEGGLEWVDVMRNFHALFKEELEEAEAKIATIKGAPALGRENEPVPCPLCNGAMVVRWSKNGKFFGCASFPECKGTLPLDAEGFPMQLRKEDIECPECKAEMVVRIGKRGPFLGCSTFPKCRGTRALEAAKSPAEKEAEQRFAGVLCNKCGSPMGVRVGRGRPFLGCSAYPECRNAISVKKAEAMVESGELQVDQEQRARALSTIAEQQQRQASIRSTAVPGGPDASQGTA